MGEEGGDPEICNVRHVPRILRKCWSSLGFSSGPICAVSPRLPPKRDTGLLTHRLFPQVNNRTPSTFPSLLLQVSNVVIIGSGLVDKVQVSQHLCEESCVCVCARARARVRCVFQSVCFQLFLLARSRPSAVFALQTQTVYKSGQPIIYRKILQAVRKVRETEGIIELDHTGGSGMVSRHDA